MIGSASKFSRLLLVAALVVLSTEHLHAQAMTSSVGPVEIILFFLILLFVVFLWRRKRKSQQPNAPEKSISESTPHEVPPDTPAPTPVLNKPPGSVFISYRREDSPHITGRIYDRLSAQLGKNFVFKDVDSIPLGLDFRENLQTKVGHCDVLVAVIGKDWNPTSASGGQRLDDPRDYLRIEIETALERRIPVIPVLVDGVTMPAEKDLPPSLAALAYRNGISVRPDPDFHSDADRLLRGIEALLEH